MHARRFSHCLFLLLLGAFIASVVISPSVTFAADDGASSEGEGEGEAEGGDHGHDTSVPATPHTDLVLITIITFGLFIFVLKKVAWGPLIEGLDKRESKYRKLLADAELDREKAVQTLADYESKLKAAHDEVTEIIAEARRDAERTKTDILSSAQQDAEATRNRALDDIERAKAQAISEVFDYMRSGVVQATEQVLSRSLTDDDHQRLIDEALAEVSAS